MGLSIFCNVLLTFIMVGALAWFARGGLAWLLHHDGAISLQQKRLAQAGLLMGPVIIVAALYVGAHFLWK